MAPIPSTIQLAISNLDHLIKRDEATYAWSGYPSSNPLGVPNPMIIVVVGVTVFPFLIGIWKQCRGRRETIGF